MKYTYIVGASFANVTDLSNGDSFTVTQDHASYDRILECIKAKDFTTAMRLMSAKAAVVQFSSASNSSGSDFVVTLEDGSCYYTFKGGAKTPLHNAIVDRIINQAEMGFDVGPLTRFMENLLNNPSPSAIAEGYLFLEACKLPITEDGHIIAYKMVRNNYFDIYSNTVKHTIGEMVSMPRFEVDGDRNNTCSRGLHFCSKEYLTAYSSSDRNTDRCLLVKINPADIVAIPSDYRNAKGRAWQYEVVGEVANGWRDTLPKEDFTKAPVVTATAGVYVPKALRTKSTDDVFSATFYYDGQFIRWNDNDIVVTYSSFLKCMSSSSVTYDAIQKYVKKTTGYSLSEVTLEDE